jgi:hypothetical protein
VRLSTVEAAQALEKTYFDERTVFSGLYGFRFLPLRATAEMQEGPAFSSERR